MTSTALQNSFSTLRYQIESSLSRSHTCRNGLLEKFVERMPSGVQRAVLWEDRIYLIYIYIYIVYPIFQGVRSGFENTQIPPWIIIEFSRFWLVNKQASEVHIRVSCTNTCTNTCTTHAQTHAQTRAQTHAQTRAQTHAQTRAQTHAVQRRNSVQHDWSRVVSSVCNLCNCWVKP